MKKLLFFLLITIGFSLQHSLMANEPDSAYVFAYATDKNAGRNGRNARSYEANMPADGTANECCHLI